MSLPVWVFLNMMCRNCHRFTCPIYAETREKKQCLIVKSNWSKFAFDDLIFGSPFPYLIQKILYPLSNLLIFIVVWAWPFKLLFNWTTSGSAHFPLKSICEPRILFSNLIRSCLVLHHLRLAACLSTPALPVTSFLISCGSSSPHTV